MAPKHIIFRIDHRLLTATEKVRALLRNVAFRRNISINITQPYTICIAQNNYAPITKNRREIVTIQKNDVFSGHLIDLTRPLMLEIGDFAAKNELILTRQQFFCQSMLEHSKVCIFLVFLRLWILFNQYSANGKCAYWNS
jgi:hypothetical protein